MQNQFICTAVHICDDDSVKREEIARKIFQRREEKNRDTKVTNANKNNTTYKYTRRIETFMSRVVP